jgi:hypothetical protein
VTAQEHYKVSVRLERVTPAEPDSQGYVRPNSEALADLLLTGGSQEEVLFQASKHVLTLHDAYEKGADR